MSKRPNVAIEDAIVLTLFAQRSPNAEFREKAFTLGLAAVGAAAPVLAELRPFCEFAARSQAKNGSAERAREVGRRLLREAGHTELRAQLAGSAKGGEPRREPAQ